MRGWNRARAGGSGFVRAPGSAFVYLLITTIATLSPSASPGESRGGTSGTPPDNPYLAAVLSPSTHFGPAQQDSVDAPGPMGDHVVAAHEVKSAWGGLININYVGPWRYPDGREVAWLVNNNRVAKVRVDGGRFEEVARLDLEGQPLLSPDEAREVARALDEAPDESSLLAWVREHYPWYMEAVAARAGVYTLLDDRGRVYTLIRDRIVVFASEDSARAESSIVKVAEYAIPDAAFHPFRVGGFVIGAILRGQRSVPWRAFAMPRAMGDFPLGLAMTFDGHIAFATFGGGLGVIDRDFEGPLYTHDLGSIVSNSFPVDRDGGLYVATNESLHKVVWTGSRLSDEPADGAWAAPIAHDGPLGGVRGGSQGTGSTPTLMGFGEEADRLVVLTDGQHVTNLVAYWRDEIPSGGDRLAGEIRVTGGFNEPKEIQSEQSVAVAEYGALVVNNAVDGVLPSAIENLVALGVTRAGPMGVERFEWNPDADQWERAWARPDVSSPSTVPVVSRSRGIAYVQGYADDSWEITGLDWATGETKSRLRLGSSQAFNGAYSQIQLLPSGDIVIGGLTGSYRITGRRDDADPDPPASR